MAHIDGTILTCSCVKLKVCARGRHGNREAIDVIRIGVSDGQWKYDSADWVEGRAVRCGGSIGGVCKVGRKI